MSAHSTHGLRPSQQIRPKRTAPSFPSILGCGVVLVCISFATGCRKEPDRSEHISALTAKEVAQKKMAELGKSQKPIILVAAESLITWRTESSGLEHTVPSWVFVFADESNSKGNISIEVRVKSEGQGMLKMKSRVTDVHFPAELAKELVGITNWVLDIEASQNILKRAGAETKDGTFLLKMREVDGILAPVWTLPLNIPGALSSGVRADDGVIVYLKDGKNERWTRYIR